jgi:SAM-dependent methyltransferase
MNTQDMYQSPGYARFYDWIYEGFNADFPMYRKLAEEHGSPILDIGCGTGREAIELARAGFEVTGLDISGFMLSLARRKIQSEPENVRNLISLYQGDMRDFRFDRTFSCIFVPNAAVFHVLDPPSLWDCLSCFFHHTRKGGVLCIDLVSPFRMANQDVGNPRMIREGVNPFTGLFTLEYNKKLEIDRKLQIVRVEHGYVEKEKNGDKRSEYIETYRWIEKEEGLSLVSSAGFTDIQTFGDYAFTPFSEESRRLIFVAGKSGL